MMWGDASQYTGKNLACSGAISTSVPGKPGIDFATSPQGQASQLEAFAREVQAHGDRITTVAVSIGGNDVGSAVYFRSGSKCYINIAIECPN